MVQTPIVTLETAKAYLRVDSADEDALIGILLNSAEQLVMDVARLSSTDWTNIQKVRTDDDGNVISIHTTKLKAAEILVFARECRAGVTHSPDEWANVLTVADEYEVYVEKHNIANGVVKADSRYIRDLYHQLSHEQKL